MYKACRIYREEKSAASGKNLLVANTLLERDFFAGFLSMRNSMK